MTRIVIAIAFIPLALGPSSGPARGVEPDSIRRYFDRREEALRAGLDRLRDRQTELAAVPSLTLAEQTDRADKAAKELDRLRKLMTEERSSSLVAMRLVNGFRRLDTERAAVVRHELAQITAQLGHYENELTAVEVDQLNESWGDRAQRDALLAGRSEAEKARAQVQFARLDQEEAAVLVGRREVLERLSERANRTRQQVLRRIAILDDQHGFIRTHLFWVRDSSPLGLATVARARAEGREVASTLLEIAAQPWTASYWQRVSPDFLWASLGALACPYGIYRIRKGLRLRHDRGRAEPCLGTTTGRCADGV